MITFDQAWYEAVIKVLNSYGAKGYTYWEEIKGSGSKTGEPHMGSHAYPSLCSAIYTVVDENKVDGILKDLHALDEERLMLGLRAFVMPVEKCI